MRTLATHLRAPNGQALCEHRNATFLTNDLNECDCVSCRSLVRKEEWRHA